ncbi:hypothetical protein PTTG_29882, partial [Puccinia triticina 1-1 BBBD Race 1]
RPHPQRQQRRQGQRRRRRRAPFFLTLTPALPQLIVLTKQQGILCPVATLRRRLSGTGSSRTPLFGYLKGGKRFHLTKKEVLSWVRTALAQKGHAYSDIVFV